MKRRAHKVGDVVFLTPYGCKALVLDAKQYRLNKLLRWRYKVEPLGGEASFWMPGYNIITLQAFTKTQPKSLISNDT
jgi:hypothetical protein